MEVHEPLPKCLVCRAAETEDAYEFDDYELDTLVHDYRIWRAPRVQRTYGAVPICRPCFDRLGFSVEGDRPEKRSPLVQLTRRRDS